MTINIILSLPAITCLISLLMTRMKKSNQNTRMFSALMFFSTLYFLHFALFNSADGTNYELLSWLDLAIQWIAFSIVPSVGLYLYSLIKKRFFRPWMALLYVPAAVQGAISTYLFFKLGPDNIIAAWKSYAVPNEFLPQYDDSMYHTYRYITETLFFRIGVIELISLLIACIWIARKMDFQPIRVYRVIFKKGETTTDKVVFLLAFLCIIQLLIYASMPPDGCSIRPLVLTILGFTLAINIFYLGYANLVHYDGTRCTYKSLTSLSLNVSSEICASIKEHTDYTSYEDVTTPQKKERTSTEQTVEDVPEIITTDDNSYASKETKAPAEKGPSETDRILFERLNKIMKEDMLFKEEDLSLDMLAVRLNTNRTYISRIVNQYYQMGFRDYINLCRIEYAMAYMQENPNDTLEVVSMKCGFPNAQTFSRKFKEIAGKTPRQWMAN